MKKGRFKVCAACGEPRKVLIKQAHLVNQCFDGETVNYGLTTMCAPCFVKHVLKVEQEIEYDALLKENVKEEADEGSQNEINR